MVGPPFDRSAGSRIEGGEDQAVLDDDVMNGKGECFMLLIRCFWVMIESKRSLMKFNEQSRRPIGTIHFENGHGTQNVRAVKSSDYTWPPDWSRDPCVWRACACAADVRAD